MLLSGRKIELHPNMVLVVSPFQIQEWHVSLDKLDYTFLIFQEEFINNFLSDKYFMYRLLYCYQHDYPTFFDMPKEDMATYLTILQQMKRELHNPVADSYHMIVACLYQFLLLLNRFYARHFNLPFAPPQNNYAYQYKELLEKHISEKTHVSDYAEGRNARVRSVGCTSAETAVAAGSEERYPFLRHVCKRDSLPPAFL